MLKHTTITVRYQKPRLPACLRLAPVRLSPHVSILGPARIPAANSPSSPPTHCAFTRLMVSGSASLGVTYSTARSMISCTLASASSRF